MSISLYETLPAIGGELLTKIKDGLSRTAIHSTVASPETAPSKSDEIRDRIDEIKRMPIEEIDIRLTGLIALSRDETLFDDTQEIPAVLTDAIHDTAELMVEEWDDKDYNLSAVAGLTEAFAITHDDALIEKAVEVVDSNPNFTTMLPGVKKAVHFAAEHAEEIDGHFKAIGPTAQQATIPMLLHDSVRTKKQPLEAPVEQVSIDEYENLFHPTIKRPTTAEYTHAGIHASLKK